MRDLTMDGYDVLSPKTLRDSGVSKSSLWLAVGNLLRKTLLPAAKVGIVFSDLRSGFDTTANVLVKSEGGQVIDLQLVDFDSFVNQEAIPSSSSDKRYLSSDFDALTYLFLQVLQLGQTYHMETIQKKVDGHILSKVALNVFNFTDRGEVPEEAVLRVWEFFSAKFSDCKFSPQPITSISNWCSAKDNSPQKLENHPSFQAISDYWDILTSIGMIQPMVRADEAAVK
jgi:hypothetical protein